jgi:hypothetical protein
MISVSSVAVVYQILESLLEKFQGLLWEFASLKNTAEKERITHGDRDARRGH